MNDLADNIKTTIQRAEEFATLKERSRVILLLRKYCIVPMNADVWRQFLCEVMEVTDVNELIGKIGKTDKEVI